MLDMTLWEQTAASAGLRLPRWNQAVTTGKMRRFLRKYSLTVTQYKVWSGERTLSQFHRLNPTWELREWAGLVLEHRAEIALNPE